LFDTLYHAVALEQGALLVSADRRYLNKAGGLGQIVGLEDWRGVLAEGRYQKVGGKKILD
jgi:hypothetical protein